MAERLSRRLARGNENVMSIDVFLAQDPDSDAPGPDSLTIEDDERFWALFPHFKRLEEVTGQMIDQYGEAQFSGEARKALLSCLLEARLALSTGTAYSTVQRTEPSDAPGGRPLERAALCELLETLDLLVSLVRLAESEDKYVMFLGD